MSIEVISSLIAAAGTIVVAAMAYLSTKRMEREAELRREKLEHYKEFALALSGVVSGDSTPDAQRAFARACNKLNLVAPQAVIAALQAFQVAIKVSATATDRELHDPLMSRLFLEMRKDLGVRPSDNQATFKVGLWASGAGPQ
ncbi:hypothetical protein [Dokdonella sp.]|uniref:hypothetical protein n=1 Tax=Dokdonella sp. TaxID=2291710 RepID=UPI002C21079D|nr:hypothetical protein [Dokdonella sp.]HPG89067.1 hypothetical protein [Hyphomicrobium sp.]HPN80522.1 hypothetical protein [Dokdonella sp.]